MAHGYLQHFAGNKALVYSAGIETHGVNPKAIAVMKGDAIDISHHTSNLIAEYLNIDFDFILTVCDNAKENCPVFPGNSKRLHFNFPDPAKAVGTEEAINEAFLAVRDSIKSYCQTFVKEQLNES